MGLDGVLAGVQIGPATAGKGPRVSPAVAKVGHRRWARASAESCRSRMLSARPAASTPKGRAAVRRFTRHRRPRKQCRGRRRRPRRRWIPAGHAASARAETAADTVMEMPDCPCRAVWPAAPDGSGVGRLRAIWLARPPRFARQRPVGRSVPAGSCDVRRGAVVRMSPPIAPVRAPAPSFSGRGHVGQGGQGKWQSTTPTADRKTIELRPRLSQPDASPRRKLEPAPFSRRDRRRRRLVSLRHGRHRAGSARLFSAPATIITAANTMTRSAAASNTCSGHQRPMAICSSPMDQIEIRTATARLYSHAIATLAICEAFGMTGDKRLQEPAQRRSISSSPRRASNLAAGAIIRAKIATPRSPVGKPRPSRAASWRGYRAQRSSIGVAHWLDSAQIAPNDASRYIYRPQDPKSQDPRDSRRPTMTSVALLTRIYLGWKRDNPACCAGPISSRPTCRARPTSTPATPTIGTTRLRSCFNSRGITGRPGTNGSHPLLINSQVASGPHAGSWDPQGRVPDRWGYVGGRIYVTTMNLLSLEVYYRHLPIYDVPVAK